jgi:anaerobic magnesium-protoporphyrin IX monomethyl ester cyclase
MLRKESNVKWSCGIRVDKVNRCILEAMASSGCVKINFGVESGVQEILDSCKKGITIRQIENAVKLAGKIGIYNSCSFVLPLPQDNPRTLQQTIDFGAQLTRIGATASTFNAATPFPGTVLYEEKRKLGIKLISDKWEDFNFLNPVFETEHLNIAQIRKFLVEAILTWHRTSHGETLAKRRIRDRIRSGDYLGRNVHRC